jgi:hypothetical protein
VYALELLPDLCLLLELGVQEDLDGEQPAILWRSSRRRSTRCPGMTAPGTEAMPAHLLACSHESLVARADPAARECGPTTDFRWRQDREPQAPRAIQQVAEYRLAA